MRNQKHFLPEVTTMMDIEAFDPAIEQLADSNIRQLTRQIIEEHCKTKKRAKKLCSRIPAPSIQNTDPRRANAMVYYADRLCRTHNVEGLARDAVLAACILDCIRTPLLDFGAINTKAEALSEPSHALDIIKNCFGTLRTIPLERPFPEGYTPPEVVVILASVITDERMIHLMWVEYQLHHPVAIIAKAA